MRPSRAPANTRLAYSTGGEVEAAPPEAAPAATKAPRGVRLRIERRASGRMVTVATGLPGTPEELDAWARELRAACGTGGTCKDGVLELQGDQRDTLEARLRARGLRCTRAGG